MASLDPTLQIRDRDHVLQALVALTQESPQFGLKLNFLLKAFVALHSFERSESLGSATFKEAEFGKF